MAVPSSVHGYECCTLDICLLMVYCVFRQKVYYYSTVLLFHHLYTLLWSLKVGHVRG